MKTIKVRLVVAMLIFGSIRLFVRNIDLPSSMIALARGIIGSIFLLLASYITKQKPSWKTIKPNLFPLIVSGASNGINWVFYFKHTNILQYQKPLYVTILLLYLSCFYLHLF